MSETPPHPVAAQDTIVLARELYSEGLPVSRILARTGLSHGTFYLWLDGGPDDGAGPRLPPLPRRRNVLGKRRRPLQGQRVSLVARLWRTAERQVRDIETRLAKNLQEPAERERDARVFAVMVKTLRDLVALDEADDDAKDTARHDDEPEFRNIDELRRELSRRVDILRRGRAADTGPDDGQPEVDV